MLGTFDYAEGSGLNTPNKEHVLNKILWFSTLGILLALLSACGSESSPPGGENIEAYTAGKV